MYYRYCAGHRGVYDLHQSVAGCIYAGCAGADYDGIAVGNHLRIETSIEKETVTDYADCDIGCTGSGGIWCVK